MLLVIKGVFAEPLITALAPVNPVQEHGIFSLLCEVRNLRNGDEVTLLRSTINGDIERLSVDKDILPSVDERMFLSVKQMKDGSVIYFLSMADVSRHDEGQYSCGINNKATNRQVIKRSVHLNVMYFPQDSYPVCNSNQPLAVLEGTTMSFNCTTADAFPSVILTWSRGGDELHTGVERTEQRGGDISTVLTFKASRSHDRSVFICTVTSPAFADMKQTCHIGPLAVHRDPKYNGGVGQTISTPPTRTFDTKNGGKIDNDPISVFTTSEKAADVHKKCQKHCAASVSSKAFFWIVSTVIAAAMAVAFLIIGLILFVKYYRLPANNNNESLDFAASSAAVRCSADKLYTELQCRQHTAAVRQIYMATEKQEEY